MEGTRLNPVEQRLVAAVKAGNELDLSTCPERERTLRADVLCKILLGRVGDEPGAGGVRLRGAVIEGDLDLSDVPATVTVDLTNCQVTRICFGGASPPPIAHKTGTERPGWLEAVDGLPGRIGKGQWQYLIT